MGTPSKADGDLAATGAQGIKGGINMDFNEVGVTNYPEGRTDADLLIKAKLVKVEKEDVNTTKLPEINQTRNPLNNRTTDDESNNISQMI